MLLYLSVSQHVSAPTGHPQVNTMVIFILNIVEEALATTTDPLFTSFVS
jgi:hypothetical protein